MLLQQPPQIETPLTLIEISKSPQLATNEQFLNAISNTKVISSYLENGIQQHNKKNEEKKERQLKKESAKKLLTEELLTITQNNEDLLKKIKTLNQNQTSLQSKITQQESTLALHSKIIGLLFGSLGCGTATVLIVWLWHYTHK